MKLIILQIDNSILTKYSENHGTQQMNEINNKETSINGPICKYYFIIDDEIFLVFSI